MKMDVSVKAKKKAAWVPQPGLMIGAGVAFILMSLLILGLGLWEAFLGGGRIKMIQVPGYQDIRLESGGLYAGVYQHRGPGALPASALAKLEVHLMSKEDYQEVNVLMNNTGQVVERLGFQGMPLFTFLAPGPGDYTLSATYPGDGKGPKVPVILFPQTAQNIKQTVIVAAVFFLTFLALGIFLIVKRHYGTPPPRPK